MNYQIVGQSDMALAHALGEVAGDMEVVGALASSGNPAAQRLASMLSQGKTFRTVNAGTDFGLAMNIALPLSLPGTLGLVGTTNAVSMSGAPNRSMKPRRLIVQTSQVGVTIENFTIAGNPQLLQQTGSVPAECFDPRSIESSWDFSVLQTAQNAIVTGTNRATSSTFVSGALYGQTTQA